MTPAIRFLKHIGATFQVHTYECQVNDDFGHHCAKQLGIPENKVFKTLLVQHDKTVLTAIIPVNKRLNLKNLAKAAHLKQVDMMNPQDAERTTGYKVGGISPFAQKKHTATYLDEHALVEKTILVSGGKRGVSVEITPQDLLQLLDAQAATIVE